MWLNTGMIMCLSTILHVDCVLTHRHGKEEKNDLQKLQGTWIVTAGNAGGQDLEDAKINVVFEKDRMQIVKDGNKREPLRFELDATKSPRTLDLYMMVGDKEKGPIKGIYALEGDTLKICYAQLPGDERPKTFASPPKSRTYYISLKRAK